MHDRYTITNHDIVFNHHQKYDQTAFVGDNSIRNKNLHKAIPKMDVKWQGPNHFASITVKLVLHLRGSKVYAEPSSLDLTKIHGKTPKIIKIFKTIANDRNKTVEAREFDCIVFVFFSKTDALTSMNLRSDTSSKNNPFLWRPIFISNH